jgi:hypothetical protein
MAKTSPVETTIWDQIRHAERKLSDAKERLTRGPAMSPTSYEMLSLDLRDASEAAMEISQILRKLEKA